MIRQIVNRCHVGQSDLQVIRYVISRLKHGFKTWQTIERVERKRMLRQAVMVHHENQAFYGYVMKGY